MYMETRSNNQNQQNQHSNQPKPGLSWTQPAQPQTKIHEQKTTTPTNTPPTTNSNKKWWVGLVVVCVLAALFAIGLRQKDGDKTGTATTTDRTSARTETIVAETMPNSVTIGSIKGLGVSPLQDAGTEVMVSVEEVSAPAWIVVYESNNGKPGNVLGAGYVTPTLLTNKIPLLRGTTSGQTYFIGQTTDDGDSTYSMQKDAALRDAEGNLVLVEFKTR